jgi:hypothetical protein
MGDENSNAEGDNMGRRGFDGLALYSVKRLLPHGEFRVELNEETSFVTVHRDHPANAEMLMNLPSNTVVHILVDAGVFAQSVTDYTNDPWTFGRYSAFGALWLAQQVAKYTEDPGW